MLSATGKGRTSVTGLRFSSVAALATVGILLAACGGQETLTHDELVQKANEVCSEPVAQAQEIVGTAPSPGEAPSEEWIAQLGEAAPLILTAAQGLATLNPPPEDEDLYSDLVAAYDTLAETMQNAANAAEAGDTALVQQQLPAAEAALEDADAAATALGIEECARPE